MVNLKELDPESSQEAAFGARLRSEREDHHWTQDQLAARMGYTGRHISGVETANKPPTRRFSVSADTALGTGDTFECMWREIRTGVLLEGFPQYVDLEGRATEVRVYEIGIIPGLLQTPEYARVLADSAVHRGAITQQQADERVGFVAERQAALVRPQPPMVIVVIDESCIRRPVGGAGVMSAQLDRLVEFAALPNTALHVAPYAIGERRTYDRPVNLLTLPDCSVVSYVESQTQGHLERETASVRPLLKAYHQLLAASASQAESVAMIRELRKGTP
ncbi:transcriptional regulator [Streptomyces inusitatus]|uniref:Transcriptional regulator n=1 Tax=Streptomyces inusitatus TaxID=68221 RepID=A0A918QKT8_9ACTN|nr:transcriptional regulator [Streptomyces inusitatus]